MTAALLMLFNMARGNGSIRHWQWLVLAFWCGVIMNDLTIAQGAFWMGLVVVVTILPTNVLLDTLHNDLNGIWKGAVRNMAAIPISIVVGLWANIFILQGLMYYICGKVFKSNQTRWAEGVTGILLGIFL